MDIVQGVFVRFFTLIYPIVHSHLVSYILILCAGLYLIKANWMLFKRVGYYKETKQKGRKTKNKKIKSIPQNPGLRFVLLSIEAVLITFVVWFVFIHFHTFRLFSA